MDNDKEVREAYEPPVVEDVPLHSDEQLLAGCKGPRHSGPGPGSIACIGRRGACVQFTRS